MAIIRPNSPTDRIHTDAVGRFNYRSSAEITIREVLNGWSRKRWPTGRVVHELVVAQGMARADMSVISPNTIAALEIKGPNDDTKRMIHQLGFFRLSVPELWLMVAEPFEEDALLMHYLLPTIGVAVIRGLTKERWREDLGQLKMETIKEPLPFKPDPKMLLTMMWVSELKEECRTHSLSDKGAHRALVDRMDAELTYDQKLAATCRQLMLRDFLYRSDAPQFHADPAPS
jgi:hypothetical protein